MRIAVKLASASVGRKMAADPAPIGPFRRFRRRFATQFGAKRVKRDHPLAANSGAK
jgi:hypothetical protein